MSTDSAMLHCPGHVGRRMESLQRSRSSRRVVNAAAALLVCNVCLLTTTGLVADETPIDAEIRAAIRDLGAKDFQTRERATQRLWAIGPAAEVALEQARESEVLEVGRRARWVLERIQAAITPDTPKPLAALVRAWHISVRDREEVIRKLTEAGIEALPIVRALQKRTPDSRLRDRLETAAQKLIREQIWLAVEAGDYDKAEAVLRQTRHDAEVMRHYATFFLLIGKIEQETERVRADWKKTGDNRLGELLMYCLRAAGRREEALVVGRELDRFVWLDGLQLETGRWKELAQDGAGWPQSGAQRVRPGWKFRTLRDKGFTAACLRLAGLPRDSERVIHEITRAAQELERGQRVSDVRDYATVFLINQRPVEAIEVLTRHGRQSHQSRPLAMTLLCLQERYDTAFELAGLKTPDAMQKAIIAAQHAKQLAGLGERTQAVALLQPLIEKAGNDSSNSTRSMIKTLIAVGSVSEGMQHVARRLQASITDSQRRTELQAVYVSPAHYGRMPTTPGWLNPAKNQIEVQRLWAILPECYPEDPTDWQLARLRHLIGFPVEQGWDHDDRLEAADQLEDFSRRQGGEELPLRLRAIAYAMQRTGEGQRARELLDNATTLTEDATPVQRYADSLAAEKKWKEAAVWYQRAAERIPQSAFLQFAIGWCHLQNGDESGREEMKRACLPFLARTADRSRGIDIHVNDRAWTDARHWLAQLTLRTDAYGSVYTMNAAGTLGNTVSQTQPRLAVQMWETLQLGLTAPGTFVSQYEQILVSQETLQRIKGRDLSQRGRIPELLTAIEAARRTMPGSELVALEFVPALRDSGHDAEAERLLQQIATVNRHVLEQYPKSHRHHHRLARLSAELDWQKEEGLQHARTAAELAPLNQTYQKTLKKLTGANNHGDPRNRSTDKP